LLAWLIRYIKTLSGYFFVVPLSIAQVEKLSVLALYKLAPTDSLSQVKAAEHQSSEVKDKFLNKLLVLDPIQSSSTLKPNVKRFVLPVALIETGFVGLRSDHVFDYDAKIHEYLIDKHAGFKTSLDNHLLFVPLAAAYGLNIAGIKGQHNLVELSVIALTTEFVTSTITDNLKTLTHEMRPDSSSADSFPSAHASSAFSKATILWLEYKDKNIWYGVGGYAVASATGVLRMLNNKHWLSDVLAGAGVGILSAQAV